MVSTSLLAVLLLSLVASSLQQCSINIKQHIAPQNSPLFIDPRTHGIIRTTDVRGNIGFAIHQTVLLACPGRGNLLTIGNRGQEKIATCVQGQTFSVDGVNYNFNQFTCLNWPQSSYRNSGRCLQAKDLIEVGFQTTTNWIGLFKACHDSVRYHTHYTEVNLLKDANTSQIGATRVDWDQGPYFQGLDPKILYRRTTERSTFTKMLGGNLGQQYISLKNDYFLSKGHMVANGDFAFNTQQQATMTYINAAPQWQTFNGKNWNELEISVRKFAGRQNLDLIVYTGTFGQAQLLNSRNAATNLFLGQYRNVDRMPVPLYYWKVIYSPTRKRATAFIGMNNPYLTVLQSQAGVFCTDISSTIGWLTWNAGCVQEGFSFACDLQTFRAVITDLPPFVSNGVLK